MIIPARSPEERVLVVRYVALKVGTDPDSLVGPYPFEALGAVRDGWLIGGVLYNNWRGASIETHWAGEPGWMTRAHLRCLFAYPFLQLKCRRVTGIIRRRNKTARKIAEKLGFRLEGVARQGYEDGEDAMIYGMLKTDCRWL